MTKIMIGLVLLVLVLLGGCGEKGRVTASSNKESTPQTLPSSPSQPDRNGSDDSSRAKQKTYIILATGGIEFDGFQLFTLSSIAKDAIPQSFRTPSMGYFEPQSLIEKGGALAIGKSYNTGYSLQVINLMSGSSHTLYSSKDGNRISNLQVSPDNKFFVFCEEINGIERIKIYDLTTEKVTLISVPKTEESSYDDRHPSFTPDGKGLTFERQFKTQSWIMSVDLYKLQQPIPLLTARTGEKFFNFRYSPDMNKYVYLKKIANKSKLILKTINSVETTLTPEKESSHELTWSPDSNEIIYWNDSLTGQSVQSYNLTTKLGQKLANINVPDATLQADETRNSYSHVCPSWTPDMKEIFYSSNSGYFDQIYKINIAENKITKLTDSNIGTAYFCPQIMNNYEE